MSTKCPLIGKRNITEFDCLYHIRHTLTCTFDISISMAGCTYIQCKYPQIKLYFICLNMSSVIIELESMSMGCKTRSENKMLLFLRAMENEPIQEAHMITG